MDNVVELLYDMDRIFELKSVFFGCVYNDMMIRMICAQVETYDKEIEEMQPLSKEEYLASLRRQSSGFSRGVSKYRGVAR